MEQVLARLNAHVEEIPQAFREIPQEKASLKTAPEKWSPKEILGHLCDSAVNNLGRFVRAQTEQPFLLTGYQQDQWVKAQAYQTRPVEEIVLLWTCLNQTILRVMTAMPTEAHENVCELPDGSTVTLGWLMADYVEHMDHHLGQIFADKKI